MRSSVPGSPSRIAYGLRNATSLAAAFAFCCMGRVEGNGRPVPVTPEDVAKSQLVFADPQSTPEQQVKAIRRVTFRPSEGVALPLRALLESVALDDRRALAVRLSAGQGLCSGFSKDPGTGTVRELLRKLARQAVESHDTLTVDALASVLNRGSYTSWPLTVQDRDRTEDIREIARRAVSHEAVALHEAGLAVLAHFGTEADADLVKPFLSDPRRKEFYNAVQLVRRNPAVAGQLRDPVWRIAANDKLWFEHRLGALHGLAAPWGQKELAVALDLFRDSGTLFYSDIILDVLLRASPENAARSLIAMAGKDDEARLEVLRCLGYALEEDIRWFNPKSEAGLARAKGLAAVRVPLFCRTLAGWAIAAEGNPEVYEKVAEDDYQKRLPLSVVAETCRLINCLDRETRNAVFLNMAPGLDSGNAYVVRSAIRFLYNQEVDCATILPKLRQLQTSKDSLVADYASRLVKRAEESKKGPPR